MSRSKRVNKAKHNRSQDPFSDFMKDPFFSDSFFEDEGDDDFSFGFGRSSLMHHKRLMDRFSELSLPQQNHNHMNNDGNIS